MRLGALVVVGSLVGQLGCSSAPDLPAYDFATDASDASDDLVVPVDDAVSDDDSTTDDDGGDGDASSMDAPEVSCPDASVACGQACVDPQIALRHCGGCDRVCAPANASGVCRAGACQVGACSFGFLDCDGDPANGCEGLTAAGCPDAGRFDAATDASTCPAMCSVNTDCNPCRSASDPASSTYCCLSGICFMSATTCSTPMDVATPPEDGAFTPDSGM